MSFWTYAFRIGQDAYLLDDDEWNEIAPFLKNRSRSIMNYRKERGCSIDAASRDERLGQAALDKYQSLTGTRLDHPDQLWGVRMRDYGSLCPNCNRLFRTPKAKMCAECGFELPTGSQAGSLFDCGR